MQRRFTLPVYLFFCGALAAQDSVKSPRYNDSIFFDAAFRRYELLIQAKHIHLTDSLETLGRLAAERNNSAARSTYYLEKAAIQLSGQKPDSALRYYYQAIAAAEKSGEQREKGNSYLSLANFYQYNGNTLAAAEYYLHATVLLKKAGRKRALIGLYRNLFIIVNRLQQKNGALQNMLSAVKADEYNENDLVKIINAQTSEEVGYNFPDQTMVKEVGTDGIYVIFGNAKFAINRFEDMVYGSVRDVQRIPKGILSLIPDFPRNGSILREITDKYIYFAKDGQLYQIDTFDELEFYGGWDAVYFVPPNSLEKFQKSSITVNSGNIYSLFNLNQEFDILGDSIRSALKKNALLSNELSRIVASRNTVLQQRKMLLWGTATGLFAFSIIVALLIRNFRQKQKLNAHTLQSLKTKQALQQKMELEKERSRIATDMHDDLGAGLSRIKFLSETIALKKSNAQPVDEEISGIRSYSHEMIDKMGEIVWALNEKNDSISDLIAYTRAYAVAYLSSHDITPRISIPENTPEHFVSGEFRRNIFLAVKEALHNIVKHAHAKNVSISVMADHSLHIVIADDGVGFETSQVKQFTNGLSNMKSRLVNIGGSFSIEQKQGVVITLVVPL